MESSGLGPTGGGVSGGRGVLSASSAHPRTMRGHLKRLRRICMMHRICSRRYRPKKHAATVVIKPGTKQKVPTTNRNKQCSCLGDRSALPHNSIDTSSSHVFLSSECRFHSRQPRYSHCLCGIDGPLFERFWPERGVYHTVTTYEPASIRRYTSCTFFLPSPSFLALS